MSFVVDVNGVSVVVGIRVVIAFVDAVTTLDVAVVCTGLVTSQLVSREVMVAWISKYCLFSTVCVVVTNDKIVASDVRPFKVLRKEIALMIFVSAF